MIKFREIDISRMSGFASKEKKFKNIKEFDKFLTQKYGFNIIGFVFEVDYQPYPKEYIFRVTLRNRLVGVITL